jgi:general secretion pathway protein M
MMALTPMNPVQSRNLAIGLLVGAVLLVVAAVAAPAWLASRHYDKALVDALDKLDRYRRIAATRPEIARDLEAMRAHDPRRFFLRSGAAALSAAEAQEALRSVIEAGGGRLITMQAPSSRDEGRYRQVTVNVQLTANVIALRKILSALETRTPYLFVDNLMVRSQVPSNFKPGPGAEPEMFVQFDVSGYALTGGA